MRTEITDEQQKIDILNGLEQLKLVEIQEEDSTGWTFAIVLETSNSEVKFTFLVEDKCTTGTGEKYQVKNMDTYFKKMIDKILHSK